MDRFLECLAQQVLAALGRSDVAIGAEHDVVGGQRVGGDEEAEVALDQATLVVGQAVRILPQLDVALHVDLLRHPVVGATGEILVPCPLVLERDQLVDVGLAIDDALVRGVDATRGDCGRIGFGSGGTDNSGVECDVLRQWSGRRSAGCNCAGLRLELRLRRARRRRGGDFIIPGKHGWFLYVSFVLQPPCYMLRRRRGPSCPVRGHLWSHASGHTARRCHAANGPPDHAPDPASHFTRDRQNAPLQIGGNSKKTPYIVCFAQTKVMGERRKNMLAALRPAHLSRICQAAISPQHCLLPAAIDLRLRHSKPASEISTIYGTTAACRFYKSGACALSAGVCNHTSTGKFQCAA